MVKAASPPKAALNQIIEKECIHLRHKQFHKLELGSADRRNDFSNTLWHSIQIETYSLSLPDLRYCCGVLNDTVPFIPDLVGTAFLS